MALDSDIHAGMTGPETIMRIAVKTRCASFDYLVRLVKARSRSRFLRWRGVK